MKFRAKFMGSSELMFLIALMRLGGKGNGADVQNQILKDHELNMTPGGLYTTLGRLEEKGLIKKEKLPKRHMRGGRERNVYTITELGKQTVKAKIDYAIESFEGLFDSNIVRPPLFSEAELNGSFSDERYPYRTMIRITKIDGNRIYIVIPGYGYGYEMVIDKTSMPEGMHHLVAVDFRFFADVNLGANFGHDLYVTNFRLE